MVSYHHDRVYLRLCKLSLFLQLALLTFFNFLKVLKKITIICKFNKYFNK